MGGMWWDVGDSPTGKDCGYEGRGWGSLITYPWQPRSVRFADLLCLRLTTWNVYIRIMSKKQNQFLRHKKITAYYQKYIHVLANVHVSFAAVIFVYMLFTIIYTSQCGSILAIVKITRLLHYYSLHVVKIIHYE